MNGTPYWGKDTFKNIREIKSKDESLISVEDLNAILQEKH